MTLYVSLQESVIAWLFRVRITEEKFLREFLRALRGDRDSDFLLSQIFGGWEKRIKKAGFTLTSETHYERWDARHSFCEIILEQIDDSGPELKIRNLLGFPLYKYGESYGLKEWVRQRGSGGNRLRTERFAQPGVIKVGDILATGEKILSPPREGGNGAVLVHLSGPEHGTWLSFPSRTALALLTPEDNPPEELIEV